MFNILNIILLIPHYIFYSPSLSLTCIFHFIHIIWRYSPCFTFPSSLSCVVPFTVWTHLTLWTGMNDFCALVALPSYWSRFLGFDMFLQLPSEYELHILAMIHWHLLNSTFVTVCYGFSRCLTMFALSCASRITCSSKKFGVGIDELEIYRIPSFSHH